MKERKLLAGLALCGLLTAGSAGVAYASDSGPSGSGSSTTAAKHNHKRCLRELAKLERRKAELEGKIDVLQRERNAALEHHDFRLAARLERRIVELQGEKARVEFEIHVVKERCDRS